MSLMANPRSAEHMDRSERGDCGDRSDRGVASVTPVPTRSRTSPVMEVLIDLEGFRYAQDAGVSFRVTTCCTAPVSEWMGSAVCGSCLGRVPEVVLAAPRLR